MTPEALKATRSRRWTWLVLGLALLAGVHSALFRDLNDYRAFHDAGTRLLEHAPMYRLHTTSQFKYSPPAAFLFALFSLLPPRVGKGLLVFLSVVALAWLASWARRQAGASSWAHSTFLLVAPEFLQLSSFGWSQSYALSCHVVREHTWLPISTLQATRRRSEGPS